MTTFFRVLDDAVDEKSSSLRQAILAVASGSVRAGVFEIDPRCFSEVPNSPFAYWISEKVRAVFAKVPAFENADRTVKQGLATADDFRWIRLWWEVGDEPLKAWRPLAKGGSFGRFYADISVVVRWNDAGRDIKEWKTDQLRLGRITANNSRCWNESHYFRAGLTWPLRGVVFSAQLVPAQCIFSIAGKMAFADESQLPALLALFNSRPFDYLMGVSAGKVGGVQYEVGLIQRMPVPNLVGRAGELLSTLARRAWSLKRTLDTATETSHAFLVPQGRFGSEAPTHAAAGGFRRTALEQELVEIQREIDACAFDLYGIDSEDRLVIESSSKRAAISEGEDGAKSVDDADEGEDADYAPAGACVLPVYSWRVGLAFGRFDKRLATGARAIPPEPSPFDPLPSRSPGMWPEAEQSDVIPPQILVDDPGHDHDLVARMTQASVGTGFDVPQDLRAWLAREFFSLHIKMYSKSRRKAPIYWQLATPSASYSVWLYLHAFTKDTLYKVQNDYVAPKLAHEERKLEALRRELGESPNAADRKTASAAEAFVDELRALLDEVKRIASLWKPNLDDGVIINFAPLWRLVPHHKAWQKDLKTTWDSLRDAEYDWANLAMHLWPERVVPKCATDRSLAIAHGLEEEFGLGWEVEAASDAHPPCRRARPRAHVAGCEGCAEESAGGPERCARCATRTGQGCGREGPMSISAVGNPYAPLMTRPPETHARGHRVGIRSDDSEAKTGPSARFEHVRGRQP